MGRDGASASKRVRNGGGSTCKGLTPSYHLMGWKRQRTIVLHLLKGKTIRHTHLGKADKDIIHCKMKDELPTGKCREM